MTLPESLPESSPSPSSSKPLPKIILSLTSYPARIDKIIAALEPLMRQSVQPDEICLWLVREEFDAAGKEVPAELTALADLTRDDSYARLPRLRILWADENLRPHNKYLWTMRAHPDDIVITADDDIVYQPDMVEVLLMMHYLHPGCVICHRAHRVLTTSEGAPARYKDWEGSLRGFIGEERRDLFATGVGGVLYPPHVFAGVGEEIALDPVRIKATTPTTDDIWLYAMEVLSDVPVVTTGRPDLHYVPDTQDTGLLHINYNGSGNDDALAAVAAAFPRFAELVAQRCETLPSERGGAKAGAGEGEGDDASRDDGGEAASASASPTVDAIHKVPAGIRHIVPEPLRRKVLEKLED